jgi:hypothetical protein
MNMNSFEKFKETVNAAKSSVFGEIDAIIAELEVNGDVEKFYEKGVKSAGGRLRKGLQSVRKAIHNPTNAATMATVKNGAKDLRDEISGN